MVGGTRWPITKWNPTLGRLFPFTNTPAVGVKSMTESEALEVLSNFGDNAATYLAMFITITFAYLMVAYFVGRALTRFQCIAISVLYIVSSLVTGTTTVGWANAWLILKSQQKTMLEQVWVFSKPGIFPALISVLIGVALLSLYFMYDVRRATDDDST